MSFRKGKFDREKTGVLRPFCPAYAVGSLPEISLDWLQSEGKSLIMLDVDHTLVEWKQENFSESVLNWIQSAKDRGFQLCILSNTRRVDRLARISEALGIKTFRGKFKPSADMYEMALREYQVSPDAAVMIGDQIMTDVLGANRAGIDAIWVQKMHGPEFAGTKINRVIEKIVTSVLYRSLVTDPSDAPEEVGNVPFFEKKVVRQLIKFCFVGAISFTIDYSIRYALLYKLKSGPVTVGNAMAKSVAESIPGVGGAVELSTLAYFLCAVIASFIATFNSFLMNRAFTFRIKDRKDAGKQAAKVYMVAYIGLAINSVIGSIVFHLIDRPFIATVIGAVCAAAWNFFGQRNFAFKAK